MAWDTHAHVLNPEQYPFSLSRAYTPQPATLDQLMEASPALNFLLVQASIENGCTSLLQTLRQARERYPGRKFRGSLIWHHSDPRLELSAENLAALHAAGVRCIRIHGIFGQGSNGTAQLVEQLKMLINSIAGKAGWAIELQLPLETWADPLLGDFLASDLCREVSVLADHCASVNVSSAKPASGNDAFASFIRLLSSCDNLFVKISALHRRYDTDIKELEYVIRSLGRCEDSLLWGSDWPHVDSSQRVLFPTPPLQVDVDAELSFIRNSLSEKAWHKMMVTNPEILFGH